MKSLWGKFTNGKTVFTSQKKAIGIIASAKERLPCRNYSKNLSFFHSNEYIQA
jgi:hypothetical protein